MNIEIKKSIKPVNYFDAINILESRLKDLYEDNEQELIWTLEKFLYDRDSIFLSCYLYLYEHVLQPVQ